MVSSSTLSTWCSRLAAAVRTLATLPLNVPLNEDHMSRRLRGVRRRRGTQQRYYHYIETQRLVRARQRARDMRQRSAVVNDVSCAPASLSAAQSAVRVATTAIARLYCSNNSSAAAVARKQHRERPGKRTAPPTVGSFYLTTSRVCAARSMLLCCQTCAVLLKCVRNVCKTVTWRGSSSCGCWCWLRVSCHDWGCLLCPVIRRARCAFAKPAALLLLTHCLH